MPVFSTSLTRDQLRQVASNLPEILAGRVSDVAGLRHGLRARIAMKFFELVKLDYIEKARAKQGAGGDSWTPLKPETLTRRRNAIGRLSGKQAKKQGGRFFNQAAYNRAYRAALAREAARLPAAQARQAARQAALAQVNAEQTKIAVARQLTPGTDYEILRDTGLLFNSLEPGQLAESGADATYSVSNGDQVVDETPGEIFVGTRVPYARYHHQGNGRMHRRLWPEQLPSEWLRQLRDAAASGIRLFGSLIQDGRL